VSIFLHHWPAGYAEQEIALQADSYLTHGFFALREGLQRLYLLVDELLLVQLSHFCRRGRSVAENHNISDYRSQGDFIAFSIKVHVAIESDER